MNEITVFRITNEITFVSKNFSRVEKKPSTTMKNESKETGTFGSTVIIFFDGFNGKQWLRQLQVVLPFLSHSIRVGTPCVPLHPYPTVFSNNVTDDAPFSRRRTVLNG